MPPSSPTLSVRARKSHGVILRALASVGQARAAEAVGKSETWVSRWKAEDAEAFADLLTALGLKPVPLDHRCYAPEFLEHLRFFAERGIAANDGPELAWDDE